MGREPIWGMRHTAVCGAPHFLLGVCSDLGRGRVFLWRARLLGLALGYLAVVLGWRAVDGRARGVDDWTQAGAGGGI
jgi:hypothetical protein